MSSPNANHQNRGVRLSIASSLLESSLNLPKQTRKKIISFCQSFRADPTKASINYESINTFKDDKLHSVRIDQAYRGIVLSIPNSVHHVLLWVANHDDAYQWATNKVFEVNERTNALQFYDVDKGTLESIGVRDEVEDDSVDLFAHRSDDEMLNVGVPKPLIGVLRRLDHWTELESLANHSSADIGRAMRELASQRSVDEILENLTIPEPEAKAKDPVETTGTTEETVENAETTALEEALQVSLERGLFAEPNDEELEQALKYPLEMWRIFLHPEQTELVTKDFSGSYLVQGGAGTGKTVALIHRIKHLAQNLLVDDEPMFVTTLTNNMVAQLQRQFETLSTTAPSARITFGTLHSAAAKVLQAYQGGQSNRPLLGKELNDWLKQNLMDAEEVGIRFSWEFMKSEWDDVIEANGVESLGEYMLVNRRGRGTPLQPQQRMALWPKFQSVIDSLDANGRTTFAQMIRKARRLLTEHGDTIFRAVLVDEVQDLTPNELRFVRALAPRKPNDLFLVGDAHQSIYGHRTPMTAGDIAVQGRASRLRLNYRTTDEIGTWAQQRLLGSKWHDLTNEEDTLEGYRADRRGPAPARQGFETLDEERAAVLDRIEVLLIEDKGDYGDTVLARDIAVVLRIAKYGQSRILNSWVDAINHRLANTAFNAAQLVKSDADLDERTIRVATMHRMKGLEFKHVFLVEVNEGMVPFAYHGEPTDKLEQELWLKNERSILYVAASRARDRLYVSWHGQPSRLVG